MVNVKEGLKLLFQLCPGMLTVFSYRSAVEQAQKTKELSRNIYAIRRDIFK
jgi:hypothetical protein